MEDISQIVAAISSFVGFFGMVGTIVSWALAIGFVVLAIMGLVRPAFRFGKGIAWKKVFIVADGETGKEIQCDLERSGLIKPKNILTKTKGQTGDQKLKGRRGISTMLVLSFLITSILETMMC